MPEFSIIIATAGESDSALEHKLENTLSLSRTHSFEVLVFSDGHTLPESLAREPSVSLHRFPRQGKTACQNQCAEKAQGSILLFTDVTADLEPDCLDALANAFIDPAVAAVGGWFEYRFKSANMEGGYLSIEHLIKSLQSRAGAVIGYFGPLYSVRKENYQPMPAFYCSDLMLPLTVINQNHLTRMEPRARSWRALDRPMGAELERKRRIVAQAASSVAHFLWQNPGFPFRHPFAFGLLLAFKVLRWMVPLIGIAVLIGLLILQPIWGAAVLGGSLVLVLLSKIASQALSLRRVQLPYYCWLVGVGGLLGLYDALRGNRYADWEPGRR